ncbi:hypothetical protein [Streptomyces incanus]|uniref:Uncharacterized protein n=1 Tax=Streptomyces incanus TaxID=887453 RepID=A0ABW0XRS0_9ACTN
MLGSPLGPRPSVPRARRTLFTFPPAALLALGALAAALAAEPGGESWPVRQLARAREGVSAEVRVDTVDGTVTLAARRGGVTVLEPAPGGIVPDTADRAGTRLLMQASVAHRRPAVRAVSVPSATGTARSDRGAAEAGPVPAGSAVHGLAVGGDPAARSRRSARPCGH